VEGAGSYIDQALVGGILSGVLLLMVVVWVVFAQNALWRVHLRSVAKAQLHVLAEEYGFVPVPIGFRAQIGAKGEMEGQRVLLLLKGGAKGVRAHLVLGPKGDQRKVVEHWNRLDGELSQWIQEQLGAALE